MAIPKYQTIAKTLTEEINTGHFRPGDKFYSESEICKRFTVSSTTAVKVLNLLHDQNFVTRIQGKGTFVAEENHQSVVLLTDLNIAKGLSEGVRVLSVHVGKDPNVLKKLNITVNTGYFEIRRLRYIGTKPVQYAISYINGKYVREDKIKDLHNFDSIYQRIRSDFNLDPFKLPFRQETRVTKDISTEISNHFEDKEDTFIIQNRLTFLPFADNSLLEFAQSYKLPDFWGIQVTAAYGIPQSTLFQ